MNRISDACSAGGTALLLLWLLAEAGALNPAPAVDWVFFGVGLGLLLAARVARRVRAAAAQRPL